MKFRTGSQAPLHQSLLASRNVLGNGNAHLEEARQLPPVPAGHRRLILVFQLPSSPPTSTQFLPVLTLPICFFNPPLAFWTVQAFPTSDVSSHLSG